MAGRSRSLTFIFSGDDRDLKRAFSSVRKDTHSLGRDIGHFSASAAKSFGLLGAAVGTGLVVELKRSHDAYRESAKVGRQTEAVLKSTGGAANVTAKDIDKLAQSISKKAGIDDEAVQSAANVLLTFTKVRNETGKGNDIFSKATSVIADMSAALGTDLQGSTIQVGKALNDPIKGVTALQRVGVSFTKDQKEQIKTLVETGHTLDAQKLILRELNTEFGGSGKAQADGFDRMKVAVENVEESIGKGLDPALQGIADEVTEVAEEVTPVIEKVSTRIGKIFDKDISLGDKFKLSGQEIQKAFAPLAREAKRAIDRADLGEKLGKAVEEGAPKIADAAAAAAPRAAGAFVRAFKNAGPWGQLITVGFLAKKMGAFGAAGGIAADTFLGTFRKRTAAAPPIGAPGAVAKGSALGPLGVVAGIGVAGAIASQDEFKGFSKGAKRMVEEARKIGAGSVAAAEGVDKLRAGFERLGDRSGPLSKDARAAARAIDTINRPALDVSRAIDRMAKGGTDSISSLRTNIRLNMRLINRNLGKGTEEAKIAFSKNFDAAISSVKQSMEDGTISVREGTKEINRLLRTNLRQFGINGTAADNYLKKGRDDAGKPLTGRGGHAMGGLIGGQGRGDIVPAMLEPGEFVIRRKVVERFGPTFFASLNSSQGVQRFAGGGMVSGDTDVRPSLLDKLRAMSSATGRAIFINSGGRTIAEQQALYNRYRAGKGPVAAKPSPNAPHVLGIAADIKPGREVFGSIASRFGLSFTVPSESWHIQDTGGAAAGGAASDGTSASTGPTRQELRERAASRFDSKVLRPIIRKFQGPLTKLGRESASLGASVDGSDRALGRLERRNDLTDEDLGDPTQRVNRLFELSGLTRFQQNRITLAKRRAAVIRKEIAKYRRLIRELKSAGKKAPPGARGKLNERLKTYQGRIADLKSELRGLGEFIEDREDDIADLGKQTQEAVGAEPTKAFDTLSSALEDIDLREGAGELTAAQANEQRGIARAGFLFGKFGAFTEHQRLQVLGDSRSASESGGPEDRSGELIDAVKGLKASIDEQNALASSIAGTSHAAAIGALSKWVDGEVNAGWNHRRQSAGNGTGANY